MTAIDYAALVERAKKHDAFDNLSVTSNKLVAELADAIECLTQPGGDVEPLNWSINTDGKRFAVYSAATVARLIAERDAALKVANALLPDYTEIDRLRAEVARLLSDDSAELTQAVPDGYVLAPIEPTPEMIEAARQATKARHICHTACILR